MELWTAQGWPVHRSTVGAAAFGGGPWSGMEGKTRGQAGVGAAAFGPDEGEDA
jgi:hypothetical protein